MLNKIVLAILACVMLGGCDVKQRAVPALDDEQGARRILHELSPWMDGSPDRSADGKTPGEPMSDRHLFAMWLMETALYETYAQHDRDYQPRPIPASVGDAIDQQRIREVAKQRVDVSYAPDSDAERLVREETMRRDREMNDRLREQEQRQAQQMLEEAQARWKTPGENAVALDGAASNPIEEPGNESHQVGDEELTWPT